MTGDQTLAISPASMASPPKQRVVWVDFIRVFVMLWIICVHGFLMEGGWKQIGLFFSAPTVFIYFFFSGVLLKNAATAWKRGLFILAVFAFWIVALRTVAFPLTRCLAGLLAGNGFAFEPENLDILYLRGSLLPNLGKLWPVHGYMWFLRVLGILTLLSPLLVRMNKWVLLVFAVAFDLWGICLLEIGRIPLDKVWLPFVLNDGYGAKALAYFLLGLFVLKIGGINRLTSWLAALPWWSLLLPFAVSVSMVALRCFGVFSPLDLMTGSGYVPIQEVSLACLLSTGIILHHLHQGVAALPEKANRVARVLIAWTASLAPCVFTVYILHMTMYRVDRVYHGWVPHCQVFEFLRPVIIFALCYAAFQLMRRVPYCSRILCFVPYRKKRKAGEGVAN